MLAILKKELSSFFSTATGYIVIGIFLLLTALFLWVIPGEFNVLMSGYANLDGLFYLAPWLFLFLCPAVSMRLFAEEKQTGTWELIKTKPFSNIQIVLGKFFAAWILAILSLLPTLIYYLTIRHLAEPFGNVDSGAFWGSFVGLFFLAAIYVSIGTFASSLSKSQIVSFIIALFLCFFMYYGFDVLTTFFSSGSFIEIIENLGIYKHYKSISRGVIDSRDLVYFLTTICVFVLLTVLKIRK